MHHCWLFHDSFFSLKTKFKVLFYNLANCRGKKNENSKWFSRWTYTHILIYYWLRVDFYLNQMKLVWLNCRHNRKKNLKLHAHRRYHKYQKLNTWDVLEHLIKCQRIVKSNFIKIYALQRVPRIKCFPIIAHRRSDIFEHFEMPTFFFSLRFKNPLFCNESCIFLLLYVCSLYAGFSLKACKKNAKGASG